MMTENLNTSNAPVRNHRVLNKTIILVTKDLEKLAANGVTELTTTQVREMIKVYQPMVNPSREVVADLLEGCGIAHKKIVKAPNGKSVPKDTWHMGAILGRAVLQIAKELGITLNNEESIKSFLGKS